MAYHPFLNSTNDLTVTEGWCCLASPTLLGTPERWETVRLLMVVHVVDVFGGYAFTIALSRRIFDGNHLLSSS